MKKALIILLIITMLFIVFEETKSAFDKETGIAYLPMMIKVIFKYHIFFPDISRQIPYPPPFQ